jgi:hypothetical protein
MLQKIVAHLIDHTLVKGTSADVDPGKPVFHVQTGQGIVEVKLADLKALYFVKDFNGQPQYRESHSPADGDARLRGSRQVELRFLDGEQMGGLMNRFPPNKSFFFVLPMDPQSNNLRILVNREAVASIKAVDGGTDAPAPPARPSASTPNPPPKPQRTSWVFDGKDIRVIDPST